MCKKEESKCVFMLGQKVSLSSPGEVVLTMHTPRLEIETSYLTFDPRGDVTQGT